MSIAALDIHPIPPPPPGIERIRITDRAQWLAVRGRDVTASVAGALFGVHPYVTAYGLWALKSGLISEDPEETPPMRRGRLLEPVAVQLLREDHPELTLDSYPHGFYYRDPGKRTGATPDVVAYDEHGRRGNIQIKNVEPSVFRRTWRDDDGNLCPPLWIAVQSILEAHLTGAEWAAVAPIVVSFGLEMPLVPVPVHDGILERLELEVAAFWRAVESGRAPDPDYGRDGKLVEALFAPCDGPIADFSRDNRLLDLVEERAGLTAAAATTKERLGEIKAEIIKKLGDVSVARLADGRTLTAKRVQCKGYTSVVEPYDYVTINVRRAKQ